MRKLKLSFLIGLVAVFLVGCINIPLGNGNKMKINKESVVFSDSDGKEHTIIFDRESGSLSIDGFGLEEGIGIGETQKIPDNFPPDIPIPENAKVFKATEEHGIITLAYETDQSTEAIDALYSKFFKSNVMVDKPNISKVESADGPLKVYQGIRKEGSLDVGFIPSLKIEDGTTVGIVYIEGNSEPPKEFPSDVFDDGSEQFPSDVFDDGSEQFPSDVFDSGSEQFPSDVFDSGSEQFPSDVFDSGSEQFPSDVFDSGSEQFPSDVFDSGSEQFPSDVFNKKANKFLDEHLPNDYPIPDNIRLYQANDMLGVVVIAFETDVSPNVFRKMLDEYYKNEKLVEEPVFSDAKNDVRVVSGKVKEGELKTRHSPSNNIKNGSNVFIIFENN